MDDLTLRTIELAVTARVPVLLWGPPGTGKTSSIRALADRLDWPCEIVIASIREPSDFAGLPIVRETGVEFAAPTWARRIADTGGILLLDELSTAPPAVQAALLRVVLERTVGDLDLPDTVSVVAAANPPESAADGWDIAPPLANRFCHVDWTVKSGLWVDGMIGGFGGPEVPTAADLDHRRHIPAARAKIAAFVRHRPDHLSRQPDDLSAASRAWPSPRSWDMASVLLAAGAAAEAGDDLRSRLVASAVGPAAAREFLGWERELDLPDPKSVLADPSSFRIPERGDRAYAAISSVVAAAIEDGSPGAWSSAWAALAAATKDRHADLAVSGVRTLLKQRPDGAMPPPHVLDQMAPVLESAGLFARLTRS